MVDDPAPDSIENPYSAQATGDAQEPTRTGVTPPNRSGCGCVIKVFIGLLLFVLTVLGLIYYVVMHTSWPLQSLTNAIEKHGESVNLRLKGVSGSISSGITIQSADWNAGHVSEIRVKYNGIIDIIRHQRLILSEVHIGKAHLNITGIKAQSDPPEGAAHDDESSAEGKSPLKLFQIDRLSLNNIELKDDATGFLLSIPSVLWIGFKAENGEIEFGELSADSDRLKIETTPSTVAGYQRQVKLLVLPKMHSVIRREINVAIEFGYVDGKLKYRCDAFENRIHLESKPDESVIVQCRGLNIDEYFAGTMPRELTVDAVRTDVPGTMFHSVEIRGGSFKLGQKRFELRPQTLERYDEGSEIQFTAATCRDGDIEIDYDLTISGEPNQMPQIRQQVSSRPSMDQREILARIFHGMKASELNDAERKDLDAKSTAFGSR